MTNFTVFGRIIWCEEMEHLKPYLEPLFITEPN